MPKRVEDQPKIKKQTRTERSIYRTSGLFEPQQPIKRTVDRPAPTTGTGGPTKPRVSEYDKYHGQPNVIQIRIPRRVLARGGRALQKFYKDAIKEGNDAHTAANPNNNKKSKKRDAIVVQFYAGTQKTAYAYYYPAEKVFALKAKSKGTKLALENLPKTDIYNQTHHPIDLINRKRAIAKLSENKLNVVQSEQVSNLPLGEIIGEDDDMELEIGGKPVAKIENNVLNIKTTPSKEEDKARFTAGVYKGQRKRASRFFFSKLLDEVESLDKVTAGVNAGLISKTDRDSNIVEFYRVRDSRFGQRKVKVAEYDKAQNTLSVIDLDYFDVIAKSTRETAQTINFANVLKFSPVTGASEWLVDKDLIEEDTLKKLANIFENLISEVESEEEDDREFVNLGGEGTSHDSEEEEEEQEEQQNDKEEEEEEEEQENDDAEIQKLMELSIQGITGGVKSGKLNLQKMKALYGNIQQLLDQKQTSQNTTTPPPSNFGNRQ